jgi:hypothetical protein
MSTEPILTAETIIATAIRNALAPFAGTYNSRPKVYWQRAEQDPATGTLPPKPYLIAQGQSDIGRVDWIGDVGATALITIKALAEYADEARELLAAASPGMNNLVYEGYTLRARYVRSPLIPVIDGVYQSAHIYRITIER